MQRRICAALGHDPAEADTVCPLVIITTSGDIIRALATTLPIADIAIEETSAESIIRNLYEGTLRFEEDADGDRRSS